MRGLIGALVSAGVLAAPAAAEWRRATTDHFVIYSQGSAQELRKSAETLERYDALLRLMSISKPDETPLKLPVFMLLDIDHVRSLLSNKQAAGFYTVGPEGPVAVTARITDYGADYGARNDDFNAQVILFHEYAHHYMLQNYTAAYPSWFVEGYAELLGATTFDADGSANVGNVATYRLAGLHTDTPIPVRRLLGAAPQSMDARDTYAFYSEAWLLTHYLVFNDTRAPQLRIYLALVNQGMKPLDAAAKAFGDLDKLNADFVAYRNAPSLPGIHISQKNAAPIGDIRVETLSTPEQAVLWDKLLYLRGVRENETAGLLDEVRRRATAAPADPMTLTLLTQLEIIPGNFDAADHAADALLAVRPNDAGGLDLKGEIAMQRLEKAKDYDPAKWAAVRKSLIAANHADANNPGVLYNYYSSFPRAHQPPSDGAKQALMRAFQLEPQSLGIRLTLASSLIGDRRYADARVALKPVAFAPPELAAAKTVETAQKMLAGIDGLADGAPPPPGKNAQGATTK